MNMEAIYKLSINNRMRAVLSVKNPEKQICGTGNYPHILVRVSIPNEDVLNFSNIEVDQDNHVIFSGAVYKPRLDDEGRPEIDTQIEANGHVSSSPCKVSMYPVYIDNLVHHHLMDLINAGQLNEPVDLGTIFSEMMTWKKIIDDAQPLVDAAERERVAKYNEQERQKKLDEERRQFEKEQKEEQERQNIIRRAACRKAWIKEYGSDMLNVAINHNYDCTSRFLTEWGRATLGEDYLLDFKGNVTTQFRTCPSDEALAELLRLESKIGAPVSFNIVWLPHGDDELRGWGNGDSACEAVEVALSEPYFDRTYYFYRLFEV
jgi:hypothetical protein